MALVERGLRGETDGRVAVIVGADADPDVPEGRVAFRFRDPRGVRRSAGGSGGLRREVWAVPADHSTRADAPIRRH
jgi:hypothetical protein